MDLNINYLTLKQFYYEKAISEELERAKTRRTL